MTATDTDPQKRFAIFYCTSDLMLGSPIHSTTESLGYTAYPIRTIEKLESRLASHTGPYAFVADLDAGQIVIDLLNRLADDPQAQPVAKVAFGPHVDTESFEKARNAGATHAMTRGQFVRNLPQIITDLAGTNFSQATTQP